MRKYDINNVKCLIVNVGGNRCKTKCFSIAGTIQGQIAGFGVFDVASATFIRVIIKRGEQYSSKQL